MVPRLERFLIVGAALLFLLALAVAQVSVLTLGSGAVIVEWTTESEVNLAGFNIYRSESLDGPYVKLNETLIPASPDPVTGGSYTYTDSTAEPGVTYYYQLEDVELDGTRTRHGPIVVVYEGGTVSSSFRVVGVLAVLEAVLLGAIVLMMRRRGRPRVVPPSTESGGRGRT